MPNSIEANDQLRSSVREQYGEIARRDSSCCAPTFCGAGPDGSLKLGYDQDQLDAAEGANLGLGCGNPPAIAALQPGEVVLDLGSGGGFDCFLAAEQVGAEGQVIGVDMTPDMVSKARGNAAKREAANVDFRLGEIERLPVADDTVDVILSNCVINLSPDKAAVFQDSFRVLKAGGRLAISDIVATSEIPEEVQKDLVAVAACVGGAASIELIESLLSDAGFIDIEVKIKAGSRDFISNWMPGSGFEEFVASAYIKATKPGGSATAKTNQSTAPCC